MLAGAIPTALAGWVVVGELLGAVTQSDGASAGPLLEAFLFVFGILYVSLALFFLFAPGFAVFLLLLRLSRRFRRRRLVAVALSPVIGALFVLIPAIPDDGAGVWSGWWFVLGACVIAAPLARLPNGASAATRAAGSAS